MTIYPVKLNVAASHSVLTATVEREVNALGFEVSLELNPDVVLLILDSPLTYALKVLRDLSREQLSRTVVSTLNPSPVYLDCIGSYKPSGVFLSTDPLMAIGAICAAARDTTSYISTSGLTKSELYTVRLLIQGHELKSIAKQLHVNPSTINSHISNILLKLQLKDRAQLLAKILAYCPDQNL